MENQKIALKNFTEEELKEFMKEIGEKPFRAEQIYKWIYEARVSDFEEMTNLSKAFREKLQRECSLGGVTIRREQISKKDGTRKFLMELSDGNMVETVLMRYHHGNSVCVSSQVGCRMGCRFCASTGGG